MKSSIARADAHLKDVENTPTNDRYRGMDWLTLLGGAAVWLVSRGHPSLLVRLGGAITAAAVVGKTTLGRRGLAKVLDAVPFRHRMN